MNINEGLAMKNIQTRKYRVIPREWQKLKRDTIFKSFSRPWEVLQLKILVAYLNAIKQNVP